MLMSADFHILACECKKDPGVILKNVLVTVSPSGNFSSHNLSLSLSESDGLRASQVF